MIFALPIMAARAVVATLTVGEAIGIGSMAFGIGAGIKGAVDYQKAKKLMAEAEKEYEAVTQRMRQHASRLKKSYKPLAA